MRDAVIFLLISILMGMLVIGLFFAQIVQYPYYARLAKNNSIRILPIDGPRGNIIDRNGKMLVTNKLAFDVAIVYQELKAFSKLQRLLSATIGMNKEDVMAAIEKASKKPYAPVTVVEDIGKERAIMLEEATIDLPGLIIQTRARRNYNYHYTGSHIFGYLSEVTEEELEALKDYGYRKKDLLGRSGIEKSYDTFLKGIDGGTQIEVDSRGRQTRLLGVKEPVPGNNLYLTIDINLQSACDKLLGARNGAAIAMNPQTGEILALASHPAFDPNIFVESNTSDERVKLLTDQIGRPLSNRAISGMYPPGSVFKMVTAAAGLETDKVSRGTRYACTGSYTLGNANFDCWKEDGHGSQNITEALKHSCNFFFYSIGRLIGVDPIEIYARAFGYGKISGIDLPGESKGVVPGKIWKRLYKKDGWYEGDTLNYSIGQGYLLATPLQVLTMTAAIANNGNIVKPHIVQRIDSTNVTIPQAKNIGLHNSTLKIIKEGMVDVVNGEGGTGKRARVEGVLVAGKTGTAQNPQGKTHGWFTGFAPSEEAKICVVVFLEHGGKGGLEPAEIARGIFEEAKKEGYF